MEKRKILKQIILDGINDASKVGFLTTRELASFLSGWIEMSLETYTIKEIAIKIALDQMKGEE